jgi:hypothetical protein
MKTETKHLRIILPVGYSPIDSVCTDGKYNEKSRKIIETIDEAKLAILHLSQTSDETYKTYWNGVSKHCKVVSVTTIIEDIEL